MTEQENNKEQNKFGIIEVSTDDPTGLPPGDYLVTDISISDWIREESNLRSGPRLRLAFWAQEISERIGVAFSLTCAAQLETGFAIFKIDLGEAEGRDVYWFDPTKDGLPQTDARPSTIFRFYRI